MKRRYLTSKAKTALWKRQGKRCAGCARTIKHVQDRIIEADHMCPIWCGGDNDEDNWQLLCRPCHATKTKRETAARAKMKRLERKRWGALKKPKGRKLESRGFDTRLRRKFDGTVEVRT